MKRICWLLLTVFTVGCGQGSQVNQLTPLEEYKLANDVLDREIRVLADVRDKLDKNDPDYDLLLKKQDSKVERAKKIQKEASERLDKNSN
jgi:hypothetical protein